MFKNNRIVRNVFLNHHVYNDPPVNGDNVYNYNVWLIILLRFDMTVLSNLFQEHFISVNLLKLNKCLTQTKL